MKLKINKRVLSILTASSITLFNGCANIENTNNNSTHRYLTFDFEKFHTISRNHKGYTISYETYNKIMEYYTYCNSKIIKNSFYSNNNTYNVNDYESIKEIEDKMSENLSYVYKLK